MNRVHASLIAGASIVVAITTFPGAVDAQAPATPAALNADAARAPAVIEALMADVDEVERKLVALAEAIPDDAYDWRPMEGVRSVAGVLMHVAADNYFIPAAAGLGDAPAATGITGDSYSSVQAYENRPVSKQEALQELRQSFRNLDQVLAGVDENSLEETFALFGQDFTGLRLWILTTTHLHEHLGQLIAYARSNRVTPPWSG